MSDLKRLQALSGRNPRQEKIDALSSAIKEIDQVFKESIEMLKLGKPLDEGIFSKLVNMIGAVDDHVGDVEKALAKKAKAFMASQGAAIKKKYETREAKTELTNLMKSMKKIVDDLAKLEQVSPKILTQDVGLKAISTAANKVMMSFIEAVQMRMVALQQEAVSIDDIHDFLIEECSMDGTLSEAKSVGSGVIDQVKSLPEYAAAAKVMKDVSSNMMLKKGTLCFDTGLNMINMNGEPTKQKYLLKIYADGSVCGEVKSSPKDGESVLSTYYRLGKKISAKDELDMYRKALANVVQRFEKKKARYSADQMAAAKAYQDFKEKFKAANFDADAVDSNSSSE